jgi:hypothetical protein
MTTFSALGPAVVSSYRAALQTAVSAYLGRYRSETRSHTESDLRIFLSWCTDHETDPLTAKRADIERYV